MFKYRHTAVTNHIHSTIAASILEYMFITVTCCKEIAKKLFEHFLNHYCKRKGKGSPYSITERRVPELIPVLGSHPAGDVSHKPGGRLPLLSTRPADTPATLKRTATNFAAW